MPSEFRIRCSTSDSALVFTGGVPRGLSGHDACVFNVDLQGRQVSAAITVHDTHPHGWSEFFADLASSWRGWPGVKAMESLEGQLSVSATSDPLGHVSLRVVLRGDSSGSNWRAEDTLTLDAGQLEGLAKESGRFFGQGVA